MPRKPNHPAPKPVRAGTLPPLARGDQGGSRPAPASLDTRRHAARNGAPRNRRLRPVWDAERRELWFGGVLVKKFHNPAPCQEAILIEFQKEGWRSRIDNPLSRLPDKNPKTRLHNAVNALNRWHLAKMIRFRNDGHGTGVIWERL